MNEPQSVAIPATNPPQPSAGQDAAKQSTPVDNRLDGAAKKVGDLIKSFSQPASQITGRIISFIGLSLVVTTFMLGIVQLLGSVDFVASIISGAALSIAGIAMITTDDVRAQRAVASLLNSPAGEKFRQDISGPQPPAQ